MFVNVSFRVICSIIHCDLLTCYFSYSSLDDTNVLDKSDPTTKWKSMFSAMVDDYSGYCTDLDAAVNLVREFLKPSTCKVRFYLKKTHHKNFGKTGDKILVT